MLFSKSLYFSYALVFFMGIAMAPRFFVGYVWAMEFLPQKNTGTATAITLGVDGLVLMWSSLYFMLIDRNWKSLYTIATIATFLTILLTYF